MILVRGNFEFHVPLILFIVRTKTEKRKFQQGNKTRVKHLHIRVYIPNTHTRASLTSDFYFHFQRETTPLWVWNVYIFAGDRPLHTDAENEEIRNQGYTEAKLMKTMLRKRHEEQKTKCGGSILCSGTDFQLIASWKGNIGLVSSHFQDHTFYMPSSGQAEGSNSTGISQIQVHGN